MQAVNLEHVSAFKYDGSKAKLRSWLARWIPGKGHTYIEPFAGRANVFFLMGKITDYDHYHLNDLRTGTPKGFLNALLTVDTADIPMKVDKQDKDYWVEQRKLETPIGVLMEAVLTRNSMTYDCWSDAQGFLGSGQVSTDFHGSGWKAGSPDKSKERWTTYTVEGLTARVLMAREVMTHTEVTITSLDYTSLPWGEYTPDDFAYLDPPYLSVNVGSYNEKDFDPERLISTLKNTRCRWLMSEYEQPIYNKAFGSPVAEYLTTQTMSPKGGQGPKKKEVLYSNFPLRFRPINFIRGSAAQQFTLDKLRSRGVSGMEQEAMTNWLTIQDMKRPQAISELVNLKYHPYVLYNGVKYWWMGG